MTDTWPGAISAVTLFTEDLAATKAFYSEVLGAGTAIFVRCKAPGAANTIVQHGVPPSEGTVGVSGSIVTRCISTVIPW